MQRGRYPADWPAISKRVREAAGWQCEWCGAPNGVTVTRAPGGYWSVEPDMGGGEDTWRTRGGVPCDTAMIAEDLGCGVEAGPEGQLLPACRVWTSKVILTVAHLGSNKHDKMDCSHLAALCQACHLREDAADHVANARRTRMGRRAVGALPGLEGL